MSAQRNARFLLLWAQRYPDTAAALVKDLRVVKDGGVRIYIRRSQVRAAGVRPMTPVAPETTPPQQRGTSESPAI